MGYQPRHIEDEEGVLRKFHLEIVEKRDRQVTVYRNLRWKTDTEKEQARLGFAVKKTTIIEGESAIKKFLDTECVASKFSEDWILVKELQDRFDEWEARENIIGSKEVEEFGAELSHDVTIKFISGVTKGKSLAKTTFKSTFVRRPIDPENRRKSKIGAWGSNLLTG